MSEIRLDAEAIMAMAAANGLRLSAEEAAALLPRLQPLLDGIGALDDLPVDGQLPANLFDARWEDRA